ncbi:ABC transporter ATP-binding protein [Cohnella suwonensis]|uniref:ABC transporter ATP-binding protein n=1 Tax=Cohnella suwonensis TaxID=696072 RepID=A0ABW0LUV9_9BACL
MNSDVAISVENISKCYKIYNKPQDRLKQGLFRGRKYYREFWALRNVSFEVKKGETIGIVGKNGSGKSTLLQIIAKTLAPTSGNIKVNGRVAALLELGSGFNPEFTGRDNIYLNGSILGFSQEEMDDLYNSIVSFADIGDFIDQPVKTYSSGMTVRLAFAVQVMVPKEILIVDEALAVGDELFQRKCYAKLEEFKQQGGTVLFVSHSGSTVVQLCDRAVFIDGGECLLVGLSKRVVNLYQKFIHAPIEKKQQLRDEIKSILSSTNLQSDSFEVEGNKISIIDQPSSMIELEAAYDPHFIFQGTIYESKGANIVSCEILDSSAKKVNLLVSRETYTWTYLVEFQKSFNDVQFGMLIKSESGLELGGAVSSWLGKGLLIKENTLVKVEFNFTANLLPGSYFLNCGVMDDSGTYITRAVDMYAFKVLHREGLLGTAIVDFHIENKITISDLENEINV